MRASQTVGSALLILVVPNCGGSLPQLPAPPALASTAQEPCVPPPPSSTPLVHQQLATALPPQQEKTIRAALEQHFQGMTGKGAFLGIAPTVAAIEAASLEEMKKCGCCRQAPFEDAAEWTAFKTEIRDGDTLVYFRNNNERWHVMGGAEGYAILRNGQVIRSFLRSMN
jgi:hypothetical protein